METTWESTPLMAVRHVFACFSRAELEFLALASPAKLPPVSMQLALQMEDENLNILFSTRVEVDGLRFAVVSGSDWAFAVNSSRLNFLDPSLENSRS